MAANNDATTDETSENNAETVDVEIYYTRGGHQRGAEEPSDEAYELAREMRTFADPDDVDAETFDLAYAKIHAGEVSLEDIVPDSRDNLRTVLSHIYSRMQGARDDEELGYDCSETRSMMMGDIIVVDGRASLVGEGACFPDLGDIEYLRGEEPHADDDDEDDDGESRTVNYRKRDTEKLVYDIRELLADFDVVEVWSDGMQKLGSVADKMNVWEIEDGNRGAIVGGRGTGDHVQPEDVVELVAYDEEDDDEAGEPMTDGGVDVVESESDVLDLRSVTRAAVADQELSKGDRIKFEFELTHSGTPVPKVGEIEDVSANSVAVLVDGTEWTLVAETVKGPNGSASGRLREISRCPMETEVEPGQ